MRSFSRESRHILRLLVIGAAEAAAAGSLHAAQDASLQGSLRLSALDPVTLAARCVVAESRDPVAGAVAEAFLSGPEVLGALLDSLEAPLREREASHSSDAVARYRLAVVLGGRVETLDGRERLEAAEALYRQSKRVLEVDPGHAGAQHLLGRLTAGVLRLGGVKRMMARLVLGGELLSTASWPVARTYLERAEEGAPCVPEHHLELAKLFDETGDAKAARRELRHVLELASTGRGTRLAGLRERALVMLGAPPG